MKRIAKMISGIACVAALVLCFAACNEPPAEPPAPPAVSFVGITVTSKPAVSAYYIGDTFDPSGAKITADYSDGSHSEEIAITKDMCSDVDMTTAGEKLVKVSYTKDGVTKEASFKITVIGEFTETGFRWNGAGNEMFTVSFGLMRDLTFDAWKTQAPDSDPAAQTAEIADMYAKLLTGTAEQAAEAAKSIGNDVIAVFYGKKANGEKIFLISQNDNVIAKNKAWDGWLNTEENGKWEPECAIGYVGATLPKNVTMLTSVSGLSENHKNWNEIKETGAVYVDLIVIRNGRMLVKTESLNFDA